VLIAVIVSVLALPDGECQHYRATGQVRHPRRRIGLTAGPQTVKPREISEGGDRIVSTTSTKVAIKPLEDRIVVQPLDAEQTTASGLVIPDTAKEKPQEGVVLAVGPGRFENGERLPLDVKTGDVVLYSKYGGTEVKYNGEDYLVLSARDVLAIVEK
jgi:Co-chaperonin GroES (HSP10)